MQRLWISYFDNPQAGQKILLIKPISPLGSPRREQYQRRDPFFAAIGGEEGLTNSVVGIFRQVADLMSVELDSLESRHQVFAVTIQSLCVRFNIKECSYFFVNICLASRMRFDLYFEILRF